MAKIRALLRHIVVQICSIKSKPQDQVKPRRQRPDAAPGPASWHKQLQKSAV